MGRPSPTGPSPLLRQRRRTTTADACSLAADQLHANIDPSVLLGDTTEDIPPLNGPIGQERAVDALRFGLRSNSFGFNVYVTGEPGVGRRTIARACVDAAAINRPPACDWCYVYNFDDSDRPVALTVPPGRGKAFAKEVDVLVTTARLAIRQSFDGDAYRRQRDTIQRANAQEHERIMEALETNARTIDFQIVVGPVGVATVPLKDGKPIADDEFNALPTGTRDEIRHRSEQITDQISDALAEIRSVDQRTIDETMNLDQRVARQAIEPAFTATRSRVLGLEKVERFLDRMQTDIIEHVAEFRTSGSAVVTDDTDSLVDRLNDANRDDLFARYAVNVLVDNSEAIHCPVVFETNPTYYNLLGRIEYRARLGAVSTGHQLIKPGALHRANGGYLVISVIDVLTHPLAWDGLKRALFSQQVEIENIGEQFSSIPTASLRPESIPLDVKVVLIGTPRSYYVLHLHDEDVRKLFKVKADFDDATPRTLEHVHQYAAFLGKVVRERKLLPFDRSAITRVVELGTRVAGDQEKLTTRLSDIADVAEESSFWASCDGCSVCGSIHVEKAISQKVYRSNLIEAKLQDLIAEGMIRIETTGTRVAQVNGLSVLTLGDYQFARPVRVSAQTAVGATGLVNLEREAHLSGPIHSKGFLILSGFIAGRYGREKPVAMDARIAFEQTYDEIEGDSASTTELFALLSSLSGLPMRQDVAVTGSVDQEGHVQPVGAVTQKVEGFFDICRLRGLTGEQGVIIPSANIRSLTVRQDVVDAVRDGRFHVWAIDTVDQGIEILTGVAAGRKGSDGRWEPDSVNDRVERTLRDFGLRLRAFGRGLVSHHLVADDAASFVPRG